MQQDEGFGSEVGGVVSLFNRTTITFFGTVSY